MVLKTDKTAAVNTPLYFIAVSVMTTKHLARNNEGVVRQESTPQSTASLMVFCSQQNAARKKVDTY